MIDDFSRDFVHIHKQSNPKEIHTLTKEGSEKAGWNRGLLFEDISYIPVLDILFSSNHNINKRLCGLCFEASDPLIERF